MADFETSTHKKKWIFSPRELFEKREAVNWRSKKMLEQYGSTRLEVVVDGSISYPEPLQDTKDGAKRPSQKPLNCEEERLMRMFYEQKIQEVCGAFKFLHKIQGTAIIYFKRFYLQWSVMEHHPKHIMLTCIYASCKVEENHVSAEELGKGIQQDHQVILNNEMIVLQSLGFDLIVYAPYRSIEGFLVDIGDFVQERDAVQNLLKELREAATFEVDKAMLTDAPLLFSPGQLALSALRRSNEVLNVINFERYLERIHSRQRQTHNISQLIESLNNIDALVDKLQIPTAKDMRHIDRKLRNCLDPSSRDDDKKQEKKSKHKPKRTSSEMQGAHVEG